MSDIDTTTIQDQVETLGQGAAGEAPVAPAAEDSPTARRGLLLVLIVLVLILCGTSYFLFSVMTPAGRVANVEEAGGLEWIRSIYGYGDTLPEQLRQPNDVAIGPDGTIWVCDQTKQQVVGFNPDGSYDTLLHQGPRGSSDLAFSFPSALAVDEDGLIYVGDPELDRVTVLRKNNTVVLQYVVPDVRSVAVKGNRVVVGSMAGFVILDKEGEVINLLGTRGSGIDQFDTVSGVAIADDGTIYAMDTYNNRLSAYDQDGGRLWIRQLGDPANNTTPIESVGLPDDPGPSPETLLPLRMTIDGNGRLVVIDSFDFSLTVLDPSDGHLIGKYGAPGDAEGQFTYPIGVSYDPARDWFAVADLYNSRAQIVRIPDSGTAPVAPVLRSLAGPWRACIFPFLLLLLLFVATIVSRRRRQTRTRRIAMQASPVGDDEKIVNE